jgi:hypothetical protein
MIYGRDLYSGWRGGRGVGWSGHGEKVKRESRKQKAESRNCEETGNWKQETTSEVGNLARKRSSLLQH